MQWRKYQMQSPKTICCLFFKICVNLKDKQYTLPRKKKVSFGKENYHSNHPTFVKLKAKDIKSTMDSLQDWWLLGRGRGEWWGQRSGGGSTPPQVGQGDASPTIGPPDWQVYLPIGAPKVTQIQRERERHWDAPWSQPLQTHRLHSWLWHEHSSGATQASPPKCQDSESAWVHIHCRDPGADRGGAPSLSSGGMGRRGHWANPHRNPLPRPAPQPASVHDGATKDPAGTTPTSKAKRDSINILADVLPEEMPTTVLQNWWSWGWMWTSTKRPLLRSFLLSCCCCPSTLSWTMSPNLNSWFTTWYLPIVPLWS